MNQSAASQPSRKKAVFSLLILLALTCVIVLIFRDHWAEITAALAQLNLWQVLVVLALGISYPLLEGCVSYVIVRGRMPGFTLRQGIDNAWCGTFGNVVTLGAGAVPVQTWYLHQAGLPIGPGVGLMTLQYVFHKTTVLLYATVMLLLQHKWLAANTTGVLKYLPMAYAVVALVIVALVLVCVSPLVQNLARWALGFLPKTEKWQQRRAGWLEQLDVLGTESRLLLADKARCVQIFALQALKLFLLFCLPWLCIRFMQLSPLSFARVQLLTSLMLFVSNALPNVAGMGSIETAFLLLYSSFLPSGEVISVLRHRQLLFRVCRQRHGLFPRPAASDPDTAKGGVTLYEEQEHPVPVRHCHFSAACTGADLSFRKDRPCIQHRGQHTGRCPGGAHSELCPLRRDGFSAAFCRRPCLSADRKRAFRPYLCQAVQPAVFLLQPRIPGGFRHCELLR